MGKHTLIPSVTVSYHTAISAECSRGGDGQCDGIIPAEQMDQIPADTAYGLSDECGCSCHRPWGGCPEDSTQNVANWHAEQWKLFG